MINRKNNQGQQTELVKNAIIRYIRDSNLSVGDKLPSQAELRKKLNVGSETIRRAIFFLRDSGILELRGNKGVFLCSENADGCVGRQIGLVCMRIPSYTYGVSLIQCLGLQLHDHGCLPVTFLRDDAPMEDHDSLARFTGLARNIRQRLVDGLITTVPLDNEAMQLCAEHDIPVCYYGNHSEYPYRVYIDQTFYADGLRKLLGFGCKRPAMIFSGYPISSEAEYIFREEVKSVLGEDKWEKYLFLTARNQRARLSTEETWKKWQKVAETILAMPENERPDGLFIPDDFMTVYFATYFLSRGMKLPPLISYRNMQIPLGMPFDMSGYFRGDIMESAQLTVDLLLQKINNPGLGPRTVFHKPQYVDMLGKDHNVDMSGFGQQVQYVIGR